MKNATELFNKPYIDCHSSESYWTTIFAIHLFYLSNLKSKAIKRFKLIEDHTFTKDHPPLMMELKLDWKDIIVEGKIRAGTFRWVTGDIPEHFSEVPSEILDLSPDVMIGSKSHNSLHIIEVKTIGAEITKHAEYLKIAGFFRKKGINVTLDYLISHGYEGRSFETLKEDGSNLWGILLWEDILTSIGQDDQHPLNQICPKLEFTAWKEEDLDK